MNSLVEALLLTQLSPSWDIGQSSLPSLDLG